MFWSLPVCSAGNGLFWNEAPKQGDYSAVAKEPLGTLCPFSNMGLNGGIIFCGGKTEKKNWLGFSPRNTHRQTCTCFMPSAVVFVFHHLVFLLCDWHPCQAILLGLHQCNSSSLWMEVNSVQSIHWFFFFFYCHIYNPLLFPLLQLSI